MTCLNQSGVSQWQNILALCLSKKTKCFSYQMHFIWDFVFCCLLLFVCLFLGCFGFFLFFFSNATTHRPSGMRRSTIDSTCLWNSSDEQCGSLQPTSTVFCYLLFFQSQEEKLYFLNHVKEFYVNKPLQNA